MSLTINNTTRAANAARSLGNTYGRLNTSLQKLSSSLRINSAAAEAVGLAIREMTRADIAAIQRGARHTADAIGMVQAPEGALGGRNCCAAGFESLGENCRLFLHLALL